MVTISSVCLYFDIVSSLDKQEPVEYAPFDIIKAPYDILSQRYIEDETEEIISSFYQPKTIKDRQDIITQCKTMFQSMLSFHPVNTILYLLRDKSVIFNNNIIGFAKVVLSQYGGRDCLLLECIFILPRFRRKQYGTIFLNFVCNHIRQQNLSYPLSFSTRSNNLPFKSLIAKLDFHCDYELYFSR
jgi:hypothetical protein